MKHLILSLSLLISVSSFASAPRTDILINDDLLRRQQDLASVLSAEQMIDLETAELQKLTRLANLTPRDAITLDQAQRLLNSLDPHPIVGNEAYNNYNRPGVQIGFCFGRAAYVHIALLKMGVNKDSIRKIWTVGPTGGQINWAFHVATIVRTTDGNWTVIDNYYNRLMTAAQWADEGRKMTEDGKKATFITDAKKFSVSLGTYSRTQMGLDMSLSNDWYRHYFKDLMAWFASPESTAYFNQFGIRHVNQIEASQIPATTTAPR